MKRYLLFMSDYYYPAGGVQDMRLAFDNVDELRNYLVANTPSNDFFNLYDCKTEAKFGSWGDGCDTCIEYLSEEEVVVKIVGEFNEWTEEEN